MRPNQFIETIIGIENLLNIVEDASNDWDEELFEPHEVRTIKNRLVHIHNATKRITANVRN